MERDQDAHLKNKVADEMEFVVQCSKCFKWLYIPTEERYEKIRENLLECPFYYEDDWAFDKPSIPQPPLGWKRIVKIRTRGTIFDSPIRKGFRSIPEDESPSYLKQHSEYASQDSKKRCPTPSDDINGANARMSMCMCL
uniref:CW-type domain-containing protein n=1 Tax=Solanum lycopersicum TaxID=4081 RepID=A0A3Q7GGK8_SOLLC